MTITVEAILNGGEAVYKLDDGRSLALLPLLPATVWLMQRGCSMREADWLLSDAESDARRTMA